MNTSIDAGPSSSAKHEGLYTLAFWIVVIVAGLTYYYLSRDYVDVFVNADTKSRSVSGAIQFKGAPVGVGVVQVSVSEIETRRYLASASAEVSDKGRFVVEDRAMADALGRESGLLVTVEFSGQHTDKPAQGKEAKAQAVTGSSKIYLNAAWPRANLLQWGSFGAVMLVGLILVVLFTGSMGQKKARMLFVAMYLFTFLSLVVPVLLSMAAANDEQILDAMVASPVGLVRGTASGLDEVQWIFNIGGSVVPANAASAAQRTPPAGAASVQTGLAPANAATEAAPVRVGDGKRGEQTGAPTVWKVQGGLAVPFYVILLAMFGAGINMTLKVPDIQRSYDLDVLPSEPPVLMSLLTLPVRAFHRERSVATTQQKKTVSDIRRELIENYMYLLSAPLLAIAMYYLLQVVAQQAAKPVLVVMAFATGLISKAVIGGIIQFAERNVLDRVQAAPKTLAEAEAALQSFTQDAEQAKATARRLAQAEFNEATERVRNTEQSVRKEQAALEQANARLADIEGQRRAAAAALAQAEQRRAAAHATIQADPADAAAGDALAAAEAEELAARAATQANDSALAQVKAELAAAQRAVDAAKKKLDAETALRANAEAALTRARAR